jgi:hypothetical protein
MVVVRISKCWWLLAHAWFVLCLSAVAYIGAVEALTSRGIGLAWYHRVGVAGMCLMSANAIMLAPGIVAVAVFWITKQGRSQREFRV